MKIANAKARMVRGTKQRIAHNILRPLVLAASKLTLAILGRSASNDAAAYDMFYKHGFHLLRRHYYLPIPDEADLHEGFWEGRSEMIGVDMNDDVALELLDGVFPPYVEEFRVLFPLHQSPGSGGFYLINGAFMAVDAHVYYALIRHFKPRRIVEIGSGFSTLVAAAAGAKNARDGEAPHLVAVEPYPQGPLKEGFPGLSEVIEARVQDVNLDLFTSLQAGDILFIDSTHALRSGGDVQFEYCEILPRLEPGVLVHVHDISLPKPYPRVYFENRLFWNEQYMLQAFLTYNSRFEVLWPGNYLMLEYPEKIHVLFPEYRAMREAFPQSEPTSFWMRAKE